MERFAGYPCRMREYSESPGLSYLVVNPLEHRRRHSVDIVGHLYLLGERGHLGGKLLAGHDIGAVVPYCTNLFVLADFLSGLNWREGGWMSPSAKLLLTTGFCGGFTTFSTFMNEGAGLMKEENYLYMMLYLFGSLALGLIAVLAGHYLAKMIA